MGGEHTPAPWVIIAARPYDGDDPDLEGSFYACAGIEGADGSPVCVFGDSSGSATMFENEADYRLIAAAPDLLEALAGWIEALDAKREFERDNPNDTTRRWEATLYALEAAETTARAVLAKATTQSEEG